MTNFSLIVSNAVVFAIIHVPLDATGDFRLSGHKAVNAPDHFSVEGPIAGLKRITVIEPLRGQSYYAATTNLLPTMEAHQASAVTDRFLDALASVESGGKPDAIGDGGWARGPFQLWRGAWQDADRRLKLNKSYQLGCFSSLRPRLLLYAGATASRETPSATLRRANLRCLQSRSFGGFSLSNCPAITRRAATKLLKQVHSGPGQSVRRHSSASKSSCCE
jgi:hypothetical protein